MARIWAGRIKLDVKFFIARLTRVNRYFEALTKSFDIMIDGMEKEQFLKYRMALIAGQRISERAIPDGGNLFDRFLQLVDKDVRKNYFTDSSLERNVRAHLLEAGSNRIVIGKEDITLEQFEKKYSAGFYGTGS